MFDHPTLRAIADLAPRQPFVGLARPKSGHRKARSFMFRTQIQSQLETSAPVVAAAPHVPTASKGATVSCKGLACRFPGGEGLEIWAQWLERRDAITVPRT